MRCGIDIIELDRFKEFLDRSGVAQLQTIFSGPELQDIQLEFLKKQDIQHLAGWFCLKEACLKIFPQETSLKIIDFGDIVIDHDSFGAPVITINDKIKELMEKHQVKAFSASLSHTDNYSCGLVIAL